MRREKYLSSLTLLVSLAFAAISTPSWAEETVRLKSSTEVDSLRRIGVSMDVGGHLLVNVKGKEERLPMKVKAVIRHQERILSLPGEGATGPEKGEASSRPHSVRYYDDIEADLTVDGKAIEPELREERRLVTVTAGAEKATLAGLYGPLSREELDLLQLPADPLTLDRLLPGDEKPRAVDATWKPDADTMGILLRLDAVGSTDVESKLYELTDELAKIEMKGTVHGALDGIATQIDLRARYYFDREQQQVTGLEMHFKEKRAISHTAPGVDVTARLKLHIKPLQTAPMLADDQLEGLASESRIAIEPLEYMAKSGRLRFMHDRRWHVTQESGQRLTMRLVNDGELIAQCNLVEQKRMKEGNRVSMLEFQDDIKRVLGDKFGAIRRAKESMNTAGNIVYEIQAEGRVADMPIEWVYYLVSARDGRRVSLVFTMEAELVERFENLDAGIIASLELLEGSTDLPTAIDPAEATAGSEDGADEKTAAVDVTEADEEEQGSLIAPAGDRAADASADDVSAGQEADEDGPALQ